MGTTLILGLLFGPGKEHCDIALAVEVRRVRLDHCDHELAVEAPEEEEEEKEDEEAGGTADIKSNNPHLTGGEKYVLWSCCGRSFSRC